MSRNGTANQEAAILRAIRASVGGSFRDTERSAGGAPGRAAPGWPQIYVGAVVIAGCGALSKALVAMTAAPPSVEWWVLAALTLLSGTAVLKVPAIPANFSISDVFTLTAAVALMRNRPVGYHWKPRTSLAQYAELVPPLVEPGVPVE